MPKRFDITKWLKDKYGRVVLFEAPNIPLISWAVCTVVGALIEEPSTLHNIINVVAFGSLFTWAWLEIADGTTYFRRVLGVAIMVVAIMNFIDKL